MTESFAKQGRRGLQKIDAHNGKKVPTFRVHMGDCSTSGPAGMNGAPGYHYMAMWSAEFEVVPLPSF